jgi:cbb3-type cytochrome oxidase maturation protein
VSYVVWLVPIALGMGVVGLSAFLWSMRSGQYDDLDGAAERVLLGKGDDRPIVDDKPNDRSARDRATKRV